jgi:hypothetical protein
MKPYLVRLTAMTIFFSAVAGCGGSPATVEGIVTLDGAALPNATVAFYPEVPGPVAYGLSNTEGRYRLKSGATMEGLQPGRYRVTVFVVPLVEGKGEPEAGPLLTPAVYASRSETPLRHEVVPGQNVVPLHLSSSARPSGQP